METDTVAHQFFQDQYQNWGIYYQLIEPGGILHTGYTPSLSAGPTYIVDILVPTLLDIFQPRETTANGLRNSLLTTYMNESLISVAKPLLSKGLLRELNTGNK